MSQRSSLMLGFAGALAARALMIRALLLKLERDVGHLNRGEYSPLLAGYGQDAVLHFNDGRTAGPVIIAASRPSSDSCANSPAQASMGGFAPCGSGEHPGR